MNTKAIIIISNELDYQIPIFVVKCDNNHTEGLMEFIYQYDINLPLSKNISAQEIAFLLGEQGYIVMLNDVEVNYNNLVIFLPKQVSPKQFEYFQKRMTGLERYNLMLFDQTKDKEWHPLDNTTTKKTIISELDRILNEKLINKSQKIKSKINKPNS